MKLTPKHIKKYVENVLEIEDLSIKSRKKKHTYPRFVAFKLTKVFFKELTFSEISDIYKNNHATIIHGIKQFDILENQTEFKNYKNVYNRAVKDLIKISNSKDYAYIQNITDLNELKESYRIMFLDITDKYRSIIRKQSLQLSNIKDNDLFDKITQLPEDEFKELKVRINAFLQMNAMNFERKRQRKLKYGKKLQIN